MSLNWQELLKSSPRELRICGPKHAKQIEDEKGLSDIIFKIYSLNFMEVSKTSLNVLPMKIKELENLSALMLYDNKLKSLPKEIGLLKKLKTLDISNNQIDNLPNEIANLSELQSFNMINNKIKSLPKDLSQWTNLIVIKFSHNKFEKFPPFLCSPTFKQHLTEIHASDNVITDLPSDIKHLSSLRHLDLSNNKIENIPGELGDCSKIKLLALQGNPIKDVRLHKMAEKNPTKQIMQYISKSCKRGSQTANGRKKTVSSSSEKADEAGDESGASANEVNSTATVTESKKKGTETLNGTIEILAVHPDKWFIIEAEGGMLNELKIVACILRNVVFEDEKDVKKFLTLQTNLHDSVCGRRELATIATHDLSKITPRVKLTKMLPHKVQLVPLNRGGKSMTGQELYKLLNQEAEAYRKEKKRNNYSGIHKYLYLLRGKTHYPVVLDGTGVPITLPPLTNAEGTKITPETKDILVEVTGGKTPDCKKVLDTLLHDMLKLKIGTKLDDMNNGLPTLQVEPVRVVRSDEEDKLFVVYPSKIDLIFNDIEIMRHFDSKGANQ